MNIQEELEHARLYLDDCDLGKLARKLIEDDIVSKKEYKEKCEALKIKQNNCKHENTSSEVSEWHPNGEPDRWITFCVDCGKVVRS